MTGKTVTRPYTYSTATNLKASDIIRADYDLARSLDADGCVLRIVLPNRLTVSLPEFKRRLNGRLDDTGELAGCRFSVITPDDGAEPYLIFRGGKGSRCRAVAGVMHEVIMAELGRSLLLVFSDEDLHVTQRVPDVPRKIARQARDAS